ncbi:MAG: VTT domain-containing protein [Xanthomonadales bacterium]|nr:VTT domain-containing protein [Xanthomonadales bacterium]
MDTAWTQELMAWVIQHPGWTAVVVFAVACIESLVLVGILIPGIVVLFGVGALIGVGAVDLWPVWLWGSLGALLGDGISYVVGRRNREHLVEVWPFSRYPALLQRGRGFFARHGNKSVLVGRFVGPLRPIIPATVGMLGMRPMRFLLIAITACVLWTPAYLLPGMLFGASLEVAAEYAGRLSLVILILAAALWLAWWLVWAIYDLLLRHSAQWLARAIRWSQRHPVIGRASRQLLDPNQPEAFSVALLALMTVVVLWSLALLIFFSPFSAQPEAIDYAVLEQASALRNHIADPFMVAIMQMSRWWVLLPAPLVVLLYLVITRHWQATVHWLAAIVGGVVIQFALGWTLKATPQLSAAGIDSFYVPSAALTLSTVVLGFFTVMIAREVGHPKWPYLVCGLVLTLLAMSRLYLGLDWLSGALVGLLLGVTWTGIVGIAYRLRARGSFSGPAVAALFILTLLASLTWQITRNIEEDLAALEPDLPHRLMERQVWWAAGWASLPVERTHFESVTARHFNAQLDAELSWLREVMTRQGWEQAPPASWRWVMKALNPDPGVDDLPLLGKDYLGHPEVLRLRRRGSDPDRQLTLRVWDSGLQLGEQRRPLYLVQLSNEHVEQRLAFFSYWKALPADSAQLDRWVNSLPGVDVRRVGEDLYLLRKRRTTESAEES